jgi:hypothetical protein
MLVVGLCLMWLKWHDIDYSMTAQFAVTSAVGTFETSRDVRSLVAIGGRADISRTTNFGCE